MDQYLYLLEYNNCNYWISVFVIIEFKIFAKVFSICNTPTINNTY